MRRALFALMSKRIVQGDTTIISDISSGMYQNGWGRLATAVKGKEGINTSYLKLEALARQTSGVNFRSISYGGQFANLTFSGQNISVNSTATGEGDNYARGFYSSTLTLNGHGSKKIRIDSQAFNNYKFGRGPQQASALNGTILTSLKGANIIELTASVESQNDRILDGWANGVITANGLLAGSKILTGDYSDTINITAKTARKSSKHYATAISQSTIDVGGGDDSITLFADGGDARALEQSTIYLGSGDDTLIIKNGRSSSNTIFGGTGNDKLVLSNARSSEVKLSADNKGNITVSGGVHSSLKLQGIEKLELADETINLNSLFGSTYSILTQSHAREGDDVVFRITRTGNTDIADNVSFSTGGNTAKEGVDYQAKSESISFKAGEIYKDVRVKTNTDYLNEGTETFYGRVVNLKTGDKKTALANIYNVQPNRPAEFGISNDLGSKKLTAKVITDDPEGNGTFTYKWKTKSAGFGSVYSYTYWGTGQSLNLNDRINLQNLYLDIVYRDGSGFNESQTLKVVDSIFETIQPNQAPILSGRKATLGNATEDTAYTLKATDLLAGFSDPDGDKVSVINLKASSGQLSDNYNGTWTYTPAADANGKVDLNYTISDGNGGELKATNSFVIDAVNDGPIVSGPVDLGTVEEDGTYRITKTQLLANSSDIDGDSLDIDGIKLAAGNGMLVSNNDDSYTFTPTADWNGEVRLSFDVKDVLGKANEHERRKDFNRDVSLRQQKYFPSNGGHGRYYYDSKTVTANLEGGSAYKVNVDVHGVWRGFGKGKVEVASIKSPSGQLLEINDSGLFYTKETGRHLLVLNGEQTGYGRVKELHSIQFDLAVEWQSEAPQTVSTSAFFEVVPVNDSPVGSPQLNGNFKLGNTVTIEPSSIKDADNHSGFQPYYKYSWEVSSDKGTTWSKITSADATDGNNSFKLTANEAGKQVRGVVSYVDGGGTKETLASTGSDVTSLSYYSIEALDNEAVEGETLKYRISRQEGVGVAGKIKVTLNKGNSDLEFRSWLLDFKAGQQYQDITISTKTDDFVEGREDISVSLEAVDDYNLVKGTGSASGFIYDKNTIGGSDDDFIVTPDGVTVVRLLGNAGSDMLVGNELDNSIDGGADNDYLWGEAGNDGIQGGAGDDIIWGEEGDDILRGGTGNDLLQGGDGNDVITGGAGSDSLFGGSGADRFVFKAWSDSTPFGDYDGIFDFNGSEGDRIDLSAIQQGLTFIGSSDFSGKAAEVRFANGELQANAAGDQQADFGVSLLGVNSFEKDFLIV